MVAAPTSPSSQKRKATASVDESAQKKPKLDDISGLDGIKPVSAKPETPEASQPVKILAKPQSPAPGRTTSVVPEAIATGTDVKSNDIEAETEARGEKGREESAVSGSTGAESEKSSPPAVKKDGPFAKGLDNFHRACYANSMIQCLNTIPELVARLEKKSRDTQDDVELRDLTEADLRGKTREVEARKRKVRAFFKKSKSRM